MYWNDRYRNMSNKVSKKDAFSKNLFYFAPNRRLNILAPANVTVKTLQGGIGYGQVTKIT